MTGFSIMRLLVLSSIVFLIASCAGGPATPSATISAAEVTASSDPVLPAATSMSALPSGMTPTPSLAGPRSTPAPTEEGVIEIEVGDYFFQPQVVTVTVGTLVTWRPVGDLQHTIVSKDASPVFKAETAGLGSKPFEFTFRKPGAYAYHCDYHPGAMDAWIVVVEDD